MTKYIAVRYPAPIQKKYDRGFTEEEKAKIGYINNQGLCKRGKINPNYFTLDQLYDLKADPTEQTNLANDPNYKDMMIKMQKRLKAYLSKFAGRPYYDLYDGKAEPIKFDEFN